MANDAFEKLKAKYGVSSMPTAKVDSMPQVKTPAANTVLEQNGAKKSLEELKRRYIPETSDNILAPAVKQNNSINTPAVNKPVNEGLERLKVKYGISSGSAVQTPAAAQAPTVSHIQEARDAQNIIVPAADNYSDEERSNMLSDLQKQIKLKQSKLDQYRTGASRASGSLGKEVLQANIDSMQKEIDDLQSQYTTLERSAAHTKEQEANWNLQDSKEAFKKTSAGIPSSRMSWTDNANNPDKMEIVKQKIAENVAARTNLETAQRVTDQLAYIKKYDNKTIDGDGAAQKFEANYTLGRLSQDQSIAWADYLDNPTEENKAYAESIGELIEQFSTNNQNIVSGSGLITKSFAAYLPQLMDQIKYEAVGAAAGGIIGTLVGNPVGGVKAGAVAGSGVYSYRAMQGAAYKNLIDLGVDPDKAKAAAKDEAVISSLIEMADTGFDIATLGGSQLLKAIATKKVTEWAGKSALKKAAIQLAKYGINVYGEGLEEELQEAVSIANEERFSSGDPERGLLKESAKTFYDAMTGEDSENAERIREAGKEGRRIALVAGGLEMGGNVLGTNVVNGFKKLDAPTQQVVRELGLDNAIAGNEESESKAFPAYGTTDPARQAQFRVAEKIAKNFGAELQVESLENGASGEYADGIITIDPNTKNPVMQVLVHELTHHMERTGQYDNFSNKVLGYIQNDMNADIDALKKAITEEYKAGGIELDDAGATKELVAKYCENKLFQDERAISRLYQQDRTLFQTVYDWITDAIQYVKGTDEERFLIRAQKMYENALKSANQSNYVQSQGAFAQKQELYAGKGARTADFNTFKNAMQMEERGVDAESIRRATGWFRGMDRKWRFEIADNNMGVDSTGVYSRNPDVRRFSELTKMAYFDMNATEEQLQELQILDKNLKGVSFAPKYLDEIVLHPSLFEAYPELRNVKIVFTDNMNGAAEAAYSPGFKEIVVKKDTVLEKEKLKKNLIHEIQHAIQDIEDFAPGSNLEMAQNSIEDELAYLQSEEDSLTKELSILETKFWDEYEPLYEKGEISERELDLRYSELNNSALARRLRENYAKQRKLREMTAFDLYHNAAGEIEARDAANRRMLTDEERGLKRPNTDSFNVLLNGNDSSEVLSAPSQNAQYSINKDLDSELQSVLDNTFSTRDSEVNVGKTSDFLKNVIGIKDIDVLMPEYKAYGAMVTEQQALAENRPYLNRIDHFHGLGKEKLIEILERAEDPVVAYTPFDNRIVLVTDIINENGAPYVVVEDLEDSGRLNGKTIQANKDITVYGRDQIANDIRDAIDNKGLLYIKKESQLPSGVTRVYAPSSLDSTDFQNNINQFLWNVKHNNGKKLTSGTESSKTSMQIAYDRAQQIREYKNAIKKNEDYRREQNASSQVKPATYVNNILSDGILSLPGLDSQAKPATDLRESYGRGFDELLSDVRGLPAPGLEAETESDIRPLPSPGLEASENVYDEVRPLPAPGSEPESEPKTSAMDNMPKKAQKFLKQAEIRLLNTLKVRFGANKYGDINSLKDSVKRLAEEYFERGFVSKRSVDNLFNQVWNDALATNEYKKGFESVLKHVKATTIRVPENIRNDITDYKYWKKNASPYLTLSNTEGIDVDKAYQEFNDLAPDLFPDDIINPADQLRHMYEIAEEMSDMDISLDEFYGSEAEDAKSVIYESFSDSIRSILNDFESARVYSDEKNAQRAAAESISPEDVKTAYKNIASLRRNKDKIVSRNLLTDSDNYVVDQMLRGNLTIDDIKDYHNNSAILAVYLAKRDYENAAKVIKQYNASRKQSLRDKADDLLRNASSWRDKGAGLLYSRETMERNFRDIIPDKKEAQRVIDEYITPVHEAEAESTRFKNEYRERVRDMKISRKVAPGNEVSESYAIQLIGEAEDAINMIQNSKGRMQYRDGKTLEDWKGEIDNLKLKNPNLDWDKINNCVEEFRTIYNELFDRMNETLIKNGYEPAAYRKGYFPHFESKTADTILDRFNQIFGIESEVSSLPTTINGITDMFRPGRAWFGNILQRKGINTDYDAVLGFDKYIKGAADTIFQTENIQNLRALATQIRYRTGDEGIQEQIDAIMDDENLTEEEKQNRISTLYEKGRFSLGNLVVELDEYTNLLANKKSRSDRNIEAKCGRGAYNLLKQVNSNVGANMVAFNPGSWLTNFIPITQGLTTVDNKYILQGMWNTLKSYKKDDGFASQSTFLTNRRGSDPLVEVWEVMTGEKQSFGRKALNSWKQAVSKLSNGMEIIDNFTSDTLVRARYLQNKASGMSDIEAMAEADSWTAGIMADRSKGSMPTLFSSQNPLNKLFTQFQLEVNNEFSWLVKDVPDELKEKGLAALALGLWKFLIGSYLFNEVYEYFVGRRSALDPLGILNDTVGDITGYELPNLVELGVNAASGKELPSFEVNKKSGNAVLTNALQNIGQEAPFIGNILGGGRLPAGNVFPDASNLVSAVTNENWSNKKKVDTLKKELAKPFFYAVVPGGGSQIKKIYQGLEAVARGGSYSVDKEGNDLLQYPIFEDNAAQFAGAAAKAVLFGKSSMSTARKWVENDFNSFGSKETAVYQGLTDAGISDQESFNFINDLRNIKSVNGKSAEYGKREYLEKSDMDPEGKAIAYYGLLASDKEKELMDDFADTNVDQGELADVLMRLKDTNILKSKRAHDSFNSVLLNSKLNETAKVQVYQKMSGKDNTDEIAEVLAAGIDFDTWLEFDNQTYGLDSSGGSTKKEKVLNIIDSLNIDSDQKDVLYLISGYSKNTLEDVPWSSDVRYLPSPGKISKPQFKVPEFDVPKYFEKK